MNERIKEQQINKVSVCMYASLFDTGSETVGQMSQENTSPKLKIDKQYKKIRKKRVQISKQRGENAEKRCGANNSVLMSRKTKNKRHQK